MSGNVVTVEYRVVWACAYVVMIEHFWWLARWACHSLRCLTRHPCCTNAITDAIR